MTVCVCVCVCERAFTCRVLHPSTGSSGWTFRFPHPPDSWCTCTDTLHPSGLTHTLLEIVRNYHTHT